MRKRRRRDGFGRREEPSHTTAESRSLDLSHLALDRAGILHSSWPKNCTPLPAQPRQTFRVFADLKHTGILTGPLTLSSPAPNEFGIAVPLPARTSGRDRWPEKIDADDPLVERLGRLRVEAIHAAGDIVVSVDSDTRRCLRLFRNDVGGWRRQALKRR